MIKKIRLDFVLICLVNIRLEHRLEYIYNINWSHDLLDSDLWGGGRGGEGAQLEAYESIYI